MLYDISPEKLAKEIEKSRKRLAPFREARYDYLRAFAGQYYNTKDYEVGDEPLNLTHNAIRVWVANTVMKYPKVVVDANLLEQRQYAELLALAVEQLAKKIKLKTTLRRWVMDAFFQLGIIKTGLTTQETLADYSNSTDPKIVLTQPYVDTVDFDDWIIDPYCRRREEAAFAGNHVLVDKRWLLESELYDNEIVEKLPSVADMKGAKGAKELSQATGANLDSERIDNLVDIAEIWVPSENVILTMPGHKDAGTNAYLREPQEAYCTDNGPYRYLAVTPEPPDNPIPISMVGLWHDLATRANTVMCKILDQAAAQKTVYGYKPSAADDAEAVMTAKNGESIAMDDPDAVREFNIGGQAAENERMLSNLMMLASQMMGGMEQLSGQRSDADSATQATILQQNAMVTVEDVKDKVYDATAEVYRELAWYLHTDPLIHVPLIRRGKDENGAPLEEQVYLTPEVRRGDFIDYAFSIQLRSMTRLDTATRIKRSVEFFSRIVPQTAMAAVSMAQLGIAFDAETALLLQAQEMGLEWMDRCFGNNALLQRYMLMQMVGPQAGDSQGQVKGTSPEGTMQNGGAPMAQPIPTQQTEFNQTVQEGANPMQQDMKMGGGI